MQVTGANSVRKGNFLSALEPEYYDVDEYTIFRTSKLQREKMVF